MAFFESLLALLAIPASKAEKEPEEAIERHPSEATIERARLKMEIRDLRVEREAMQAELRALRQLAHATAQQMIQQQNRLPQVGQFLQTQDQKNWADAYAQAQGKINSRMQNQIYPCTCVPGRANVFRMGE